MKKIKDYLKEIFFEDEEEYQFYKPYMFFLLVSTAISLGLTLLINLAYMGM